jgi:hypothetical protein
VRESFLCFELVIELVETYAAESRLQPKGMSTYLEATGCFPLALPRQPQGERFFHNLPKRFPRFSRVFPQLPEDSIIDA